MIEVDALKNPGAHVSHVGGAVADPAIIVYLPGGHFVAVTLGTTFGNTAKRTVTMGRVLKSFILKCKALSSL